MRLKVFLITVLIIAVCLFNQQMGLFRPYEATLLICCAGLAGVSVFLHSDSKYPSSIVAVLASIILLIAYVVQPILFLINARSLTSTVNDVIGLRSIFSVAALGANELQVRSSLEIISFAFLGLFVAALILRLICNPSGESKDAILSQAALSPIPVGVGGLLIVIFFGALRKMYGLESAAPSGLPPGVGGIINIASAYIGPNLTYAAIFIALDSGRDSVARKMSLISIVVGLFNYVLFTSKMSLVFPIVFILFSQLVTGKRIIKLSWILLAGLALVIVYPFLNLYRSASVLGVSAGELLVTIFDLYSMAQESSGVERGALQVAISSIIGRFVGYDPLLILLQANPYPGDLFAYVLDGDLDKYLTYEILNFQDSMGYSPGLVGRSYYISRSFEFVSLSVFFVVFLVSYGSHLFWRKGGVNKYQSIVLMTYCLPFFSDGMRYELVRSLLFSAAISYVLILNLSNKFPDSSRVLLETRGRV